mgnify:CR=1 FL=1
MNTDKQKTTTMLVVILLLNIALIFCVGYILMTLNLEQ